ncbi:hypothetical protein BJF85_03605 [Saccharomonospora sp. CUA-673]|uniref:NUDIX hydrolase n=1 Tax=Saccharomonospora sp. CUA-673 TaxID=1904969 RepID=UPI00095C2383|nr:NUDIX hydrolase [Saccharomonospora sp. CUA-673]OLT43147.1 hypothetical protein BJF85_03605 [Saccharomonospora sp. CUA-673]
MLVGDGDGFVACACGQRHWGLFGAAGLLLTDPRRGVLLQHRAGWTHQGGSWALPGGAVQFDETSAQAAARETEEETAVPGEAFRVLAQRADDHGTWRYTTVLATLAASAGAVEPRVTNAESMALRWVAPADVDGYPLHAGFAAAWPDLRAQLDRELVLIVGTGQDGMGRDAVGRERLDGLARVGVRASDIGLDGLPGAEHWTWWPRVELTADPGAAELAASVRALRAQRPRDHLVLVSADPVEDADAVLDPARLRRLLENYP